MYTLQQQLFIPKAQSSRLREATQYKGVTKTGSLENPKYDVQFVFCDTGKKRHPKIYGFQSDIAAARAFDLLAIRRMLEKSATDLPPTAATNHPYSDYKDNPSLLSLVITSSRDDLIYGLKSCAKKAFTLATANLIDELEQGIECARNEEAEKQQAGEGGRQSYEMDAPDNAGQGRKRGGGGGRSNQSNAEKGAKKPRKRKGGKSTTTTDGGGGGGGEDDGDYDDGGGNLNSMFFSQNHQFTIPPLTIPTSMDLSALPQLPLHSNGNNACLDNGGGGGITSSLFSFLTSSLPQFHDLDNSNDNNDNNNVNRDSNFFFSNQHALNLMEAATTNTDNNIDGQDPPASNANDNNNNNNSNGDRTQATPAAIEDGIVSKIPTDTLFTPPGAPKGLKFLQEMLLLAITSGSFDALCALDITRLWATLKMGGDWKQTPYTTMPPVYYTHLIPQLASAIKLETLMVDLQGWMEDGEMKKLMLPLFQVATNGVIKTLMPQAANNNNNMNNNGMNDGAGDKRVTIASSPVQQQQQQQPVELPQQVQSPSAKVLNTLSDLLHGQGTGEDSSGLDPLLI